METAFIQLVNHLFNLSKSKQYDKFDDNLRGKWNHYLNEINSLDFNLLNVGECEHTKNLIRAMTTIPPDEDMLIVKSSFILMSISKKQKIKFTEFDLKTTLEWLLNAIRINLCVGLCDILRAVEALLKSVDADITQIADSLVSTNRGILMVLLLNPTKLHDKALNYENCLPSEILLSTLSCLKTLLNSPIKVGEPELNEIMKQTHQIIYKNASEKFSESNYCLLIAFSLNICRQVCLRDRKICLKYVGENIGAAKAFMMFGLSDVDHSVHLQKVHISQQSIEPATFNPNKGGKVAKLRKPGAMFKGRRKPNKSKITPSNDEPFFQSSDNEFNVYTTSDSDSADPGRGRHKQSIEMKLRLNALSLIGVIGRLVDTKALFGYWHSLFPSDIATPSTVSILNAAIRDPNPRCRIAAFQATTIILHGSKPFLSQAEQNDKPHSSYIPFSITLGGMIVSMYSSINQALSTESSLPVLIQVLKCLASLVQATPFNRFKGGLISSIMVYLRRLVYHRDPSIQVNALIVISSILRQCEITKEISDCIGLPQLVVKKSKIQQDILGTASDVDEYVDMEDDEKLDDVPNISQDNYEIDKSMLSTEYSGPKLVSKMSWLLQVVLNNLGVNGQGSMRNPSVQSVTMVRIESLQMISTIATHFDLIKNYLREIAEAINNSFESGCLEVRMHAVKCLDVIGYWINMNLSNEKIDNTTDVELCLSFWTSIMPKVIEQIQHSNDVAALKSICCDALSNIGIHVYERLQHNKQIALISLLSGCSCDDEFVVQAAAVRALAVYIIFPSLRENVCYVENTSDAVIRALHQENSDVRIKGSWALANISDALVANSSDKNKDVVSTDLLRRLLEVSLICKDNDKVRCNGVRAIGNLLRLITDDHLKSEFWIHLCFQSIQELNQNVSHRGNAKLNWNACHAVGNLMRNSAMFSPAMHLNWQDDVIKALCLVMLHNPNFKVRINATNALSIPSDGKFLQTYFAHIWLCLLEALDRSDEITDFNEYQHRDHLTEQLCITISHYIKHATFDQLITMEKEVLRFDTTNTNWKRVINRVLPEKATSLISAAMRLQNMMGDVVQRDQRKALITLTNVFESILN